MVIFDGEVRQIGIEVISNTGQEFVIDAAEYSVEDSDGTEIENGLPAIDGHKITMLFTASGTGVFFVIFKYHIGPEILIAKIDVEVR